MARKIAGFSLGGLVVLVALLMAYLVAPTEFQATSPILGLSWWMVILIGALLYGASVFGLFRGASAGFRRIAKFAGVALAGFALLAVFILPAMTVGPGPGPGARVPQAQLTIGEGTVFDFPDFTTDDDGATGNAEIHLNSQTLVVTLTVTGDASADTLVPDSFAIDFTLRRTDGGWVEDGTVVEVAYNARIVGLGDWVLAGNNTDIKVFEQDPDGTKQIAWTDIVPSTIVGPEDGGAMGLFSPGESGTFTFSMYMNENGLPGNIADGGAVFTKTAIIEVFSPAGGTAFHVQLSLVLTNNT